MTGDGSLAELLDALAPPLEYLAADGFREAARTRLAAADARGACSREPGRIAAPGSIGRSASSTTSWRARARRRRIARAALLRRAHELLPRCATSEPATWTEYRSGSSRSRRRSRP